MINTFIDDLQESVNHLVGLGVTAVVRGRFIEPYDSLQPAVRAAARSFGMETSKYKVRMTGATLAVEDRIIRSLAWQFVENDESKVKIEVNLSAQIKMADDYLSRALELAALGRTALLTCEAAP